MLYWICIAVRRKAVRFGSEQVPLALPSRKRTSLPRAEVPSHEQVVEGVDTNELEKVGDDLLGDRLLDVVALKCFPDLVEDVEDVVHREGRSTVALNKSTEESSSSLVGDEAWQRLALDEGGDNHLSELPLRLLNPGMVDVVLERVEVVLDDLDESLVVLPLKRSADALVVAGSDALENVLFGDANEREELVDVGQPEDTRDDAVVVLEGLQVVRQSESVTCRTKGQGELEHSQEDASGFPA